MMATFTAVYDACVLYPAPLRDLLMRLAMTDPSDRHVVAAAVRTRAAVIVTFNLDDFPPKVLEPLGLETQHPDDFIAHLIDLSPDAVCGAAKRQRASLRKPPRSVEQFLATLARQGLPTTVARLRDFSELL